MLYQMFYGAVKTLADLKNTNKQALNPKTWFLCDKHVMKGYCTRLKVFFFQMQHCLLLKVILLVGGHAKKMKKKSPSFCVTTM